MEDFAPSEIAIEIRRVALAAAVDLVKAGCASADDVARLAQEFDGFLRGSVRKEPTP
jgi:hypothetical protein